jgi:hypothetical protein
MIKAALLISVFAELLILCYSGERESEFMLTNRIMNDNFSSSTNITTLKEI